MRQRQSGCFKILRGEAHMWESFHHEVTGEVEDRIQQQLQQQQGTEINEFKARKIIIQN